MHRNEAGGLILIHHHRFPLGPLVGDPVLHLLLGRLDLRCQLVLLGELDEQAVDLGVVACARQLPLSADSIEFEGEEGGDVAEETT